MLRSVYTLLLCFSFCRRLIIITAISVNMFHLTVGLYSVQMVFLLLANLEKIYQNVFGLLLYVHVYYRQMFN